MKLYSGPLSMFGAKVDIALREKGAAFELEMVPFDMPTTHAHPNLLAWHVLMTERPAAKQVIDAMIGYLRSVGSPVPDIGTAS